MEESDLTRRAAYAHVERVLPHPRTILHPETHEVIAIAIGATWAYCDHRDPGDEDVRR